jgi:hypothetical protein
VIVLPGLIGLLILLTVLGVGIWIVHEFQKEYRARRRS